MMLPVGDRRDRYREQVDAAVASFGAHNAKPSWTDEQQARARRICYCVIFTECDWRNYANMKVEGSIDITPNDGYPSHGGDALSTGLYQQQGKWWGSVAGSMDPFVATVRFLTAMLRDAKDWFTMDVPTVCQAVQRSGFADASNYRARMEQALALEANPSYFTDGSHG